MPGLFANAQQELAEKMVAALDSFSYLRPQEKAYIQTDRESYMAGETIWFKAYALLNGKSTILSKIIYADLVDESGRVIEKNMLELKEGTGDGSISLKKELRDGNYVLRCYTLWMLNFPDFIPEKKIRIWNTVTGPKKNASPAAIPSYQLQFLPEGGNLVAGLSSHVAFKGIALNGSPLDFTGEILDEQNNQVGSLGKPHYGMGNFTFTPAPGKKYRAAIMLPSGVKNLLDLPVSLPEGIVLTVDNSNPVKTFIKVERSEKNKEAYNELLIVAQKDYRVVYMGKLNIDEGLDAAAISKKNLPPGIMVITVLDKNGRPLAERLVFVANHQTGNQLLEGKLVDIGKRKKNSIQLDAAGYNGLQAAVSVIRADQEEIVDRKGILSSLLLSSDLRGEVFDPGYYFRDKDPARLQELDLVMRTQGWRRYRTEDILANRFDPLHYPFETSLHISGKVLNSNGKTPLQSGKIDLILKGEDSTHIMSEARTDPQGRFVVDKIGFKKLATVYYQGTNINRSEAIVSVSIDSAYFDTLQRAGLMTVVQPKAGMPDPFIQQQLEKKNRADSGKGKLLSEVVVRGRKQSEADSLNTVYATDIFFNSDQTLVLNHNFNYNDIWQYLRMTVPGIAINQTDTGMQVNFSRYEGLDLFSENTTNSSVQFFLNEVAVNISIIDLLDPSDVALVKIFKGATGIALGADRGAIAIYTQKGKTGRDWRQKGFDFFRRAGYTDNREFYQVDYSKIKPETELPDIRKTLYWNPSLQWVNGKASIEFYNDDGGAHYKVIVEGIDKDGKLLQAEKTW
ncbi:MAG: hypothetical protein IPP31_12920 [Chitinophagaceae bacterium]|nr:hypothetical protein [Chitinophagaceae bacterium]